MYSSARALTELVRLVQPLPHPLISLSLQSVQVTKGLAHHRRNIRRHDDPRVCKHRSVTDISMRETI